MYFNFKEIDLNEDKNFKIHGRTLKDDEGLQLSWGNTGVELNFSGERIEFLFSDYKSEQPVYVKTFFENYAQRFCLNGETPRVVIDFEKDNIHTVKLLRVSASDEPLTLKSIRIYGRNPKFLKPPKEKDLKIEFLGDSITVGYGVLAPESRDVHYTHEEDSTKTYAFMTAELLDADIRTVAISGQGVYRECGKEVGIQFKRMFCMNTRTVDGYDHSLWTPDVVVLNCGTNDEPGGTSLETMYDEGKNLLNLVRSTYPNAQIIWVYGMMNHKFYETLKKLIKDTQKAGDKNVHFLHVKDNRAVKNEVGAVGHPNVNASVRVSKKLAKLIRSILK